MIFKSSLIYFWGIISNPQDTLIKLPKDKILFFGMFIFLFVELVNFMMLFTTDARDLAMTIGDSAMLEGLDNLDEENLKLINERIRNFFVISCSIRLFAGVAIFFMAPYLITIVAKWLKRRIEYYKMVNIFGFAFIPQVLFFLLMLILKPLGIEERFGSFIAILSYIVTIYTFALIFAGVYLNSEKIKEDIKNE